ncbi:perakine reductase-like isoform X2 [Momordica charantia]|uniref:Perakine reductase-like isoform X2 n=1 Tax=Momordica charantia TaxID=3673 RepID=A0A6J1C9V6_MOMCH|nr:perakine reductase-like isoform X2 [Momordica charantia]
MPQNLIQIPRVKLGSQGLEVSRLGFGCAGLSGIYNAPLTHKDGCGMIKQVFTRGITFFDTSDLYGADHDNEIMALKQLPREKIQLATKFGIVPLGDFRFSVNGTPEYVRKSCEASLERLQVDHIDLYYQHRVDPSVPIEETVSSFCIEFSTAERKMGELKKLVEEGKIKYIGLSEASADTIRRAHAVHPITALQMEYSLWSRDIEDEIIPLCRELGIGMVAYSPLGRGFFGGKAVAESLPSESLLVKHPRFAKESLEENEAIYKRLLDMAAKHRCATVQLALAWLLHQGIDIVPIPVPTLCFVFHSGKGTTKVGNLDSNIRSLGVELTPEDLKEIGDAVPVDEVRGQREYDVFSKYMWNFADKGAESQRKTFRDLELVTTADI